MRYDVITKNNGIILQRILSLFNQSKCLSLCSYREGSSKVWPYELAYTSETDYLVLRHSLKQL